MLGGVPENHKIPLTPIRYNVQQTPHDGIVRRPSLGSEKWGSKLDQPKERPRLSRFSPPFRFLSDIFGRAMALPYSGLEVVPKSPTPPASQPSQPANQSATYQQYSDIHPRPGFWKRYRLWVLGLLIACVIGAVVGGAVGGTRHKYSDGRANGLLEYVRSYYPSLVYSEETATLSNPFPSPTVEISQGCTIADTMRFFELEESEYVYTDSRFYTEPRNFFGRVQAG
jgi:hypothetical protein